MGGTHFLQTGYLLLNRNAPLHSLYKESYILFAYMSIFFYFFLFLSSFIFKFIIMLLFQSIYRLRNSHLASAHLSYRLICCSVRSCSFTLRTIVSICSAPAYLFTRSRSSAFSCNSSVLSLIFLILPL